MRQGRRQLISFLAMAALLAGLAAAPLDDAMAARHSPSHDFAWKPSPGVETQIVTYSPQPRPGPLSGLSRTTAMLQKLFHGRLPALERPLTIANDDWLVDGAANGSPCQFGKDPFITGLSTLLSSAPAVSLLERATTKVDYARLLDFTIWSDFPMLPRPAAAPSRAPAPSGDGRLPHLALPAIALACLAMFAVVCIPIRRATRHSAPRRQ